MSYGWDEIRMKIVIATIDTIADVMEFLINLSFSTGIFPLIKRYSAIFNSSMNFENRWVLKSALNFASDGEVVKEVGREFQRKRPEKAKADLAKECLTRVKKKQEEEDDCKPGR
ncbi:hypothetical protein HELRODRAFT_172640 [Helobdella robusta]|uniref:Uncharacterized protein n=1 Tax=Helobdella robusta TaxID=6412 RepID=T1F5P5_HELRO|nr:hypothetical protein HELRODRAFT_172640 [Helobdella robusta]ESO04283.1 hypothetical protein HELRODRAFT_172640 [Helobdella robusta]